MNKKVLCIVGTRPEVIKMAPVIQTLSGVPNIQVSVLSSGQHREMLLPLIKWFGLHIDADLCVMTEGQTLSELTARLLQGFESQLTASRPDLVIAQGDTTTVLCAALSCFYQGIPFAHVEAGLRTFKVSEPFPEEFNRVAVGRLACLHFCPTSRASSNLLAEHIDPSTVHLTGNTVIDALQFTTQRLKQRPAREFDHTVLLTAHRRENLGEPLVAICQAVLDLCRQFPELKVLYPVHPNPQVRGVAERLLGNHPQIRLSEPLDYPDLVAAMQQAKIILTDSGGIQEEAPALGKPVLVLRAVTERPEAVELGAAKLVGANRDLIVAEASQLLRDEESYQMMARGVSPYGDGHAGAKIRDIVLAHLQQGHAWR
ncbi:MAG: UDP-N-acetylglucosamine 2-epimerase (non-hydrolyzing) [Polaromonas sp.]|nr:UDP-N-acetylglucosamine 2-epimerase (non-hydrolyzing) [Polaromonas sp.]